MLKATLTNDQKVPVILRPRTKFGSPAKVDGVPVWNLAGGDIRVEVAPDGLTGVIFAGNDLGDSLVIITADADLGSGVVTISDSILVTVISATAQNIGITVGTSVSK